MDSLTVAPASTTIPSAKLPDWALPRGRELTEVDAAFAAAIALKSRDDLGGFANGCGRRCRPGRKAVLVTRVLARRSRTITTPFVEELAALLGIRWDDGLSAIPDRIDSAIQSGRVAPFAVADLITAIFAVRPDAEVMALGLAEVVVAQKLNWPKPVPLLLPERFGPAFRTIGGRGRLRPGEPAYPKAICLQ